MESKNDCVIMASTCDVSFKISKISFKEGKPRAEEEFVFSPKHQIFNFVQLKNNLSRLILSTKQKQLAVWDIQEKKLLQTIEAHEKFVLGILSLEFYKPNYIASGGENGIVKVWNMETGECVDSSPAIKNFGKIIHIVKITNNVIAFNGFLSIAMYDLDKKQIISNVKTCHEREIAQILCSDYLKGNIISCGSDEVSLKIWDVKNNLALIKDIKTNVWPQRMIVLKQRQDILVFVSVINNELNIWSLKDFTLLAKIEYGGSQLVEVKPNVICVADNDNYFSFFDIEDVKNIKMLGSLNGFGQRCQNMMIIES